MSEKPTQLYPCVTLLGYRPLSTSLDPGLHDLRDQSYPLSRSLEDVLNSYTTATSLSPATFIVRRNRGSILAVSMIRHNYHPEMYGGAGGLYPERLVVKGYGCTRTMVRNLAEGVGQNYKNDIKKLYSFLCALVTHPVSMLSDLPRGLALISVGCTIFAPVYVELLIRALKDLYEAPASPDYTL